MGSDLGKCSECKLDLLFQTASLLSSSAKNALPMASPGEWNLGRGAGRGWGARAVRANVYVSDTAGGATRMGTQHLDRVSGFQGPP